MDDTDMLPIYSSTTSHSVDLNHLGKQLLQASKDGNDVKVRSLLSQGAPFITNMFGCSALHLSCKNGHCSTTELLARAGVSWHSRTKADKTPLHFAAQNGHRGVVEVLLKIGVDLDAVDMLQMTALHWAVVENHFHVIKLLVEHNADLDVKNKFDKTVLETAEDSENFHIVEYLKSSTNRQSFEVAPLSPPDSSQAVLASFAALCGSPSLTESIPWLNQGNTSGGAPVLLEGTNLVSLTEGGKMALQAWTSFYEEEISKDDGQPTGTNIVNTMEPNDKVVLSLSADNNLFTSTTPRNLAQPIRLVVTPNNLAKTKENSLSSGKRKRKLSFQHQLKQMQDDVERVELQRRLALAQLEVADCREKLLLKEQEVSLWKKKLEKSTKSRK